MQQPMLEEILSRGFLVLVTDGDPDCPGASLASAFQPLSTYDLLGHRALALSLEVRPRAVLTVAADVGPTVSLLAQVLGLPAASYQSALCARDKGLLRLVTQTAHPVWKCLQGPAELAQAADLWERQAFSAGISPYPCLVKARDNCAGRGLSLVSEPRQFHQALDLALAANREVQDSVLIEERLYGPEIALDFLDQVLVNVAERAFLAPGLEWGHFNVSARSSLYLEPARLALQAAQQLGVLRGPFKADLIEDPRYGWCLLECATRLSGGFDHSHTARLGPQTRITAAMLDYALGLPLDLQKLRPQRPWLGVALAPECPVGQLAAWDGPSKPLPETEVYLTRTAIRPLRSSADRSLFVLAAGLSRSEALTRAEERLQSLSLRYRDRDEESHAHPPDRSYWEPWLSREAAGLA